MKLIDSPITKKQLQQIATKSFGNLVKAVVDVEKRIMMIDASLHSDEEASLLSSGSHQSDLWGINLYPELDGDEFVEFDSMINLRPGQNNMSRGVDDVHTQSQIRDIVTHLIQ